MSVFNICGYETLRYSLLVTSFICLSLSCFFYYFTHYKCTQDSFHTYIYFFIKKTLMNTDAFYLCVCQ